MITQRQERILKSIVQEYIKNAQPVSSEFLQKKCDFEISPATIRIEMQKLTEKGFLFQPHTSAGRVPTDKGYRFFVDSLFKNGLAEFQEDNLIETKIENTINFIQNITKKLAVFSKTLVLSYLEKEKIFWKNGWEEVLREPEFGEKRYLINFTDFLESFEKEFENFELRFFNEEESKIKVFIGRENPFKKARDFSVITSKCFLLDDNEVIFTLTGPKRMDYYKNISLMNSLIKKLDNF